MQQLSKSKSILYHLYPGVLITLLLKILLNRLLAPFLEEVYFRGYLLARMEIWGKMAPVLRALLSLGMIFQQKQELTISDTICYIQESFPSFKDEIKRPLHHHATPDGPDRFGSGACP
jgi:hypothetical protein